MLGRGRIEGDAMKDGKPYALIRSTVESIPGAHIAAIGLSFALYVYEARRMSSFQNVEPGGDTSGIPGLIALVALAVLFIVYWRRPTFRLHRHPLVGFLIAGLLAASSFLSSGASFLPQDGFIMLLEKTTFQTCELLLMLCWAELIIPLGAKCMAVTFVLALISLACANALTALLKENAVHTLVATFPLISIMCLYWFKDRRSSFDHYEADSEVKPFAMFALDDSLMPPNSSRKVVGSSLLVFLLPLTCYSFVFGHIHYSWVPTQDGSLASLAIQLAAAAGTLLASGALLLLISYFWGRKKLELYNLFMLPILILTLYLTTLLGGQLAFLYVVPLNIVQKLAFFLIWLVPFLLPAKKSPLATWCLALSLYQLGKTLSTSASGVSDSLLYALAVVTFIVILIAGSIAGIVLDRGHAAPEPSSTDRDEPRNEKSPPREKQGDRCNELAKEYQLTRREEEILNLLAKGMTAQTIAETLVVSTATAKSHMRNIYAKLDIHAQSELILLIHREGR